MRKIYFIALSAITLTAAAAPVTPQQALQRLNNDGPRKIASREFNLRLVEQTTFPELYFFTSGEGFMVLPADDAAPALLGYADSGQLDLSNPNLAYWLSTYNLQISSSQGVRPIMRISRPAIAPMTETHWNQTAPYNDLCPEQDGKRCVTGCVATALAQVMKYHNYPPKGTGTHSYTWGSQTLSFDYGSTTFDWDNMTNTYDSNSSAESKTAVATLMYACGVGVNMDYSPTESGAVSRDMGTALLDYFGYDKGLQILYRDFYGLTDWEDIIYDELNAGRPVLYGGQGSAGGHQFVCDGYSADGYFHFNWGWGGMSDGYFLLTALDPSSLGVGGGAGGFNYNQNIMIGVQPPTSANSEAYLFYADGFAPSATSVSLGSNISFGNGFYNYSYFTTPSDTRIGLKVQPADGSDPTYLSVEVGEIQPQYGISYFTTQFPTSLNAGTYTITPVYQVNGGDWEFMRSPLSGTTQLTATVNGSTVTFSAPDAAKISVSDLTLETALYWGTTCKISFTITNSGASEFYDGLIPVLISSDGQSLIANGSTYPVDIMPGTTEQADYVGTFAADSVPSAGSYLLGICDPKGRLVCNPIEVTLNAEPTNTTIEVSNLRMTTADPYSGQGAARFSFTAKCIEGYYADRLTVAIFPETGGSAIASGDTDIAYLGAGDSSTLTAEIDLSGLKTGRYMAVVFQGSQEISQPTYFNVETSVGITQISASPDITSDSCYDLQGRKVAHPTPGNIYIINGKKVAYRF